jgi:hypothetical protein
MPWFRMDNHWFEDARIEAAAEEAGPMVLAVFPVLLAKAKTQADGGRVEFTYRKLSEAMFAEWDQINPAIEALVSAGVLSCPHASERDATVAFDPMSWRRWQEASRKAASREEAKAA